MTAKITDKLKKQLAQQIFDEATGTKIGDSDNYYYIAVGRSQDWPTEATPPTPNPVEYDERTFRYDMQSIKAVEAFSFVIPLKDWTSGASYAQFSDNDVGQGTSFYVRTTDNNVYICIRQGKDSNGAGQVSTVKPDHTGTAIPIETDGYAWKFLYTISTADGNSFLTANWMPVKFADSATYSDPTSTYYTQYLVQNAADSGQIVGYRVTAGGSGYTNTDSCTVIGDGINAKARIIVDGTGAIAAVEVGDSANFGETNFTPLANGFGSGYSRANVRITTSGGSNASISPVIAPKDGLGANPINDLRSTALMFNIKPEGNVDGKFVVDNEYRQIGLLRNPLQYNSNSKFTGTAARALSQLNLTTIPSTITFGEDILINGDSNAQSYLDYWNNIKLWYHQNETTGFTPFRAGEVVTVAGYSASTLTVDSISAPEIDVYSGDVLYINNTTDVPREAQGSEDIKLVVKL